MNQKDLLWGKWNIWFSYYQPEEQQKKDDYTDNLCKVHTL